MIKYSSLLLFRRLSLILMCLLINNDEIFITLPFSLNLNLLHGTKGLEEVRCNISNRIARVIFYVEDNTIILLHGFIKKSQETPQKELDVAIKRYKDCVSR